MADDYKISDLTTIGTVDNNDLMEISAVNQASPTGYSSMKIPMTKLGDKLVNGIQYASDLHTTQKTIVGAINELEARGVVGNLDDLSDVEISSPANNQVLKYDATSQKWVNGEGGGGSSGDHITLTQAEYDALVQAGTVDPDAYYFISDGSPSAYTEKVLYTNLDESSWVSQGAGDTITLSDDITQFDEVRFEGAFFETNNNTGYKLTHFCSAIVPKATIVDCLNKYGDSSSGALQWQGMFDLNFISLYSGSQFSASYALKIPTSTSILVKLKSIVGWTASQWSITKIVGINYDVVGGETHQYSTEEQIVGKWVDGSPVYEKVIQTAVNVDLTSLSIDVMVEITGCVNHTNGKWTPISYASSDRDYAVPVYDSTTKILIVAASSTAIGGTWYVIIRYTKTSS